MYYSHTTACADSSCLVCDEGSDICTACVQGWYVTPDAVCARCPAGCVFCRNPQSCESCRQGAFWDAEVLRCKCKFNSWIAVAMYCCTCCCPLLMRLLILFTACHDTCADCSSAKACNICVQENTFKVTTTTLTSCECRCIHPMFDEQHKGT